MTEDTVVDTSICEPSMTAGEVGMLLFAADDSPEELCALWRGAVARSRAGWAAALAGGGLDQASKLTLGTGESPDLRRVLVDLHDGYARHVGHADLLREAVDGLVGEDPPQPR